MMNISHQTKKCSRKACLAVSAGLAMLKGNRKGRSYNNNRHRGTEAQRHRVYSFPFVLFLLGFGISASHYSLVPKIKKYILNSAIVILLFSVLCSLFSVSIWAQEGKIVSQIELRGNKVVSDGQILLLLQTKEGKPFSSSGLSEDIKRLFDTGFFKDIKSDVKEEDEKASVILNLEENPVIAEIKIDGNRRLKKKKIRNALGLEIGSFYTTEKLRSAKSKIISLYEKKKFLFTEVDASKKETEKGKVSLCFKIKEGRNYRVRRIEIIGNKSFSNKKVLSLMKTRRRNIFLFRLGTFNEDTLEEDRQKILELYKKSGFAESKVKTSITLEKKFLLIKITIEEGKKYICSKVTLSGDLLFPEEKIHKLIKLKEGSPYSKEALSIDQEALFSFYRDKGYLLARISPSFFYNPETDRVEVNFSINPDGIVEVERIDIVGNTKTKDKVIRRELKIKPGEKFDGEKLKRSLRNLANLNYFEDVQIATSPGSKPQTCNLIFDIKEKEKTGQFLFGAGYSTIDKIVGFVAVEQNNFDLANWPSFTGGGQNIRVSTEFGSERRSYYLSFTEPWFLDHPVSLGFDLYSRKREWNEYDEQRTGGDIRTGFRFGDYYHLNFTLRSEKVKISNVIDTAMQDIKDEEGENNINSLTTQFIRDTRDYILFPTSGSKNSLSIECAGGFLSGDKDFLKEIAESTFYFPLPKKFVFSTHTLLGNVHSFEGTEKVPIFERFFTGGAKSVRGYKERSIGPKDSAGNYIGGNCIFLENLEVTRQIYKDILGIAFFTDLGYVWEKPSKISFSDIKKGVGAGLRIKVPIFPIPLRLDYGYALDPYPGEKNGRIHFTMEWWF